MSFRDSVTEKRNLIFKIDDNEQPSPNHELSSKGKEAMVEPSPHGNVLLPDFEFPADKVAEIQITTVVMHAWSQVEHGVIYKNPYRISVNDTMARMLDGINGLLINSEIMLQELAATIDQAEKEAKARDDTWFRENPERLATFLQEEFLKDNVDLKACQHWVSVLTMVAGSGPLNPYPGRVICTPAKLRNFVKEHKILKNRRKKQDFAVAILIKLGDQHREQTLQMSWLEGICFRHSIPAKEGDEIPDLYACMLVANAFSIMVAIDGQNAIDQFKNLFSSGIENLRQINALALGIEIPVTSGTLRELQEFSAKFLETSTYDIHNLAVALARLLNVIKILFNQKEDHRPISYSDLRGRYGELQSVFFWVCNNEDVPQVKFRASVEGTRGTNHPGYAHIKTRMTRGGVSGFRGFQSDGIDSDKTKSDTNVTMDRLDHRHLSAMMASMVSTWRESMGYLRFA